MLIDHNKHAFRIEIPRTEISQFSDLAGRLNSLSSNFIDNSLGERVAMWNFENFGAALKAILAIQAVTNGKPMISHRLICEEMNALFFQYGDFPEIKVTPND